MLTVWRLVTARLAKTAFSGEGARLYGGRWNRKGIRMAYTAGSQSLAMLEMLVQDEPLRARYNDERRSSKSRRWRHGNSLIPIITFPESAAPRHR